MITDGEAIRPGQLDLLDLAERGSAHWGMRLIRLCRVKEAFKKCHKYGLVSEENS